MKTYCLNSCIKTHNDKIKRTLLVLITRLLTPFYLNTIIFVPNIESINCKFI